MTALAVRVDTTSPVPPCEQIRTQLAALILTRQLAEGERLTTVRQLATDRGMAAGTVARAYRELEAAELIRTRRGAGSRVAAGAVRCNTLRSESTRHAGTGLYFGSPRTGRRQRSHPDRLAEGVGRVGSVTRDRDDELVELGRDWVAMSGAHYLDEQLTKLLKGSGE